VGVDINHGYVEACKLNFTDYDRVQIYEKSFYDVKDINSEPYDIIFFSFSFMLMPDKKKALQLAKTLIKDDGRIVFMLTLNKTRNALFERLKPLIRRLTTIDFGEVVYENDFTELIENAGLTVVKK
jgi:ubiquinone/menaquinone biosynthesis C-methylase UbiE